MGCVELKAKAFVLFTVVRPHLACVQRFEQIEHLTLQAFEVLQRHVQKIAAAAGWVQHEHGAQAVVKGLDGLDGFALFGTGVGAQFVDGIQLGLGFGFVFALVFFVFGPARR